jgi:hypothetical protein
MGLMLEDSVSQALNTGDNCRMHMLPPVQYVHRSHILLLLRDEKFRRTWQSISVDQRQQAMFAVGSGLLQYFGKLIPPASQEGLSSDNVLLCGKSPND